MKARLLFLTIGAAFLLTAGPRVATGQDDEKPPLEDQNQADAELKAEVPELMAFHEVIYPLWHKAWPERDLQWMKDLLPKVRGHVQAVQEVILPGILRDKQAAWDQGVADLVATLGDYEKAAAESDEDGLLAAVEKLHSNFEALVRTVRPVMEELDAYHVELYKIYHRYAPERDLENLRAAAAEMSLRCHELTKAEIPRWYTGKEERLHAAIVDLCLRTATLNDVLEDDNWNEILEAVDSVHSHYQKVEQLFD